MNKMKRAWLLMISLMLLIAAFPAIGETAAALPPMTWDTYDQAPEALGPLTLGMPEQEIKAQLGEPETAGTPELWGADGLLHWTLAYPAQGLSLDLAGISAGEGTLYAIHAAAPCALATARGLAIGTPRETVLTLYAGLINPEWDEEASGSILIGTIFGGIMIGIENGLVSSLFIGAMAE